MTSTSTHPTISRATHLAEALLEDAAAGRHGLAATLATAVLTSQVVEVDDERDSLWGALVAVEHLPGLDRHLLEAQAERSDRVSAGQVAYDIIGHRRSSSWTAQSIVERGAGLDMGDDPKPSPIESWWYYQGRSEAFAESMTVLEREGLATVTLVVDGATR